MTKCKSCGETLSAKKINKISNVKLSKSIYTYDKKAKKPTVTVKDTKGKKLKKGKDYTVTYAKGRKAIGNYKVTIQLKGKKYNGKGDIDISDCTCRYIDQICKGRKNKGCGKLEDADKEYKRLYYSVFFK